MATGALGGVPTTTARNFAFGSSISNFVFYTCPSNTISYVNLRFSEAQNISNQIVQLGVSYTSGYSGTVYKYLNPVAIGGFGGLPFGSLMGTTCFFTCNYGATTSLGTLFNSGLSGQIDNPQFTEIVYNGSFAGYFRGVSGQLILYPGQSLYVTATIVGGNTNIIYDTLEVTAGS